MKKTFDKAFYISWRAVRKQIVKRDNYTCEDCDGMAEEMHHKVGMTPEYAIRYPDPSEA